MSCRKSAACKPVPPRRAADPPCDHEAMKAWIDEYLVPALLDQYLNEQRTEQPEKVKL